MKLENRIGYKCRIWLSGIRWSRKTIFEHIKKSIFKIEIFLSEVAVKKISLILENSFGYICRIWPSMIGWFGKTIFEAIKKSILKIEIFWSEIEVKKFLWNWKIELAKNAEYDSSWCANQEKLYMSPSKNQFLRSKFFGLKLRLKNYFQTGKSNLLKTHNMTQRVPLIRKNYILAHQKINFYDQNFLVTKWG